MLRALTVKNYSLKWLTPKVLKRALWHPKKRSARRLDFLLA